MLIYFVFFTAFFPYSLLLGSTVDAILHQGNQSYLQGEQATAFEARQQAFNQALTFYHLAEKQMEPSPPQLNNALGDSYFQLGEYSWALLHYLRALKKNPNDSLIFSRLAKTYEKLGLPPQFPLHTFKEKVLLEPYFSLPQRFELFLWCALITLLAGSLFIWFSSPLFRNLFFVSTVIMFLLLGNVLFSYYFIPLEGLIISSTGFYREPNLKQPQLSNDPLLTGSKVQVLQTTHEGDWLKIMTSDGVVGYIQAVSIRII